MVSADGIERDDVIAYEGCPHHIIEMTRKITPFADLASLWKLYRFFRKEKPDIVHSHTPKAGLLAMLAAKMAGIKIRIHTVAGLRFMTAAGLSRNILVRMEKLTASAATHVWPNSSSLMEYIKENRLARPDKLGMIGKGSSNGIDLGRFSGASLDTAKMEATRQLVQYDPSLTYLLCVGRIVRDKGITEVAHAFSKLYEANANLRLILVGGFEEHLDPLDPNTMQWLKTHPGVIMAGWHDEVEYFMELADIFVHASNREGFPNVVLQAGALECPVICSRIPGNIDIVDDGINGLIFSVKDCNDLYEKLQQALTDRAGMKALATRLRKKIEENFDRRQVQAMLKEQYDRLLHEAGKKR